MKILVFAHRLEIGGTQVNAIELSAALRDCHGHEVVFFATPGPIAEFALAKQLKLMPAPDSGFHPSLRRMAALRRAVHSEQPDVIHAWDWPQGLDAYYGVALSGGLPLVVTDMSMTVGRVMPKAVPTTFGTPELVKIAKQLGRSPVELLVPPVDVQANAPGAVDARPFAKKYGVTKGRVTIVTVSRLTEWMKAESLRRTMEAVGVLSREFLIRFLIVGEGPAREPLEAEARRINAAAGDDVIMFTGPLVDPRTAYAAADVVVGMGGSGLRAMAFAKPLVVVGEQGFSALFDRRTAEDFYFRGIYGLGDGDPGNVRLIGTLRQLLSQRASFEGLGAFSRQFVVERFSLEVMAAKLSTILEAAVRHRPGFRIAASDGLRTSALLLGGKIVPPGLKQMVHAARQRLSY